MTVSSLCPILCPPGRDMAANIASPECRRPRFTIEIVPIYNDFVCREVKMEIPAEHESRG
jgi:hypothetical protein